MRMTKFFFVYNDVHTCDVIWMCPYGNKGSYVKTTGLPRYSFIHTFSLRGQELPDLSKRLLKVFSSVFLLYLSALLVKRFHCAYITHLRIGTMVKVQLN
jgi:hypothetical protein